MLKIGPITAKLSRFYEILKLPNFILFLSKIILENNHHEKDSKRKTKYVVDSRTLSLW